MYVCMCVCLYVCMYVCMYIYTYIYTLHIFDKTCMYIHINTKVCMYMYVYVYSIYICNKPSEWGISPPLARGSKGREEMFFTVAASDQNQCVKMWGIAVSIEHGLC